MIHYVHENSLFIAPTTPWFWLPNSLEGCVALRGIYLQMRLARLLVCFNNRTRKIIFRIVVNHLANFNRWHVTCQRVLCVHVGLP